MTKFLAFYACHWQIKQSYLFVMVGCILIDSRQLWHHHSERQTGLEHLGKCCTVGAGLNESRMHYNTKNPKVNVPAGSALVTWLAMMENFKKTRMRSKPSSRPNGWSGPGIQFGSYLSGWTNEIFGSAYHKWQLEIDKIHVRLGFGVIWWP